MHESVDSLLAAGHISVMKAFVILALILPVVACSGDPRSYGITGPGPQAAPASMRAPTGDDTGAVPGVPTSGSYYGPSRGPIAGGSGFWGYN